LRRAQRKGPIGYNGTPQIHPNLPLPLRQLLPPSNTPISNLTPLITPNGIWIQSSNEPFCHSTLSGHTHRWSRQQIRNISAPLAVVIESDTLKTNLSLVSNLAPLLELQVLQSFQLQGLCPLTPHRGLCPPWTPNGVPAPDPYIGSCSCARHDLWCMCNGTRKILWPRAWQSHNPALDMAMVWSSLWVACTRGEVCYQ